MYKVEYEHLIDIISFVTNSSRRHSAHDVTRIPSKQCMLMLTDHLRQNHYLVLFVIYRLYSVYPHASEHAI